MDAYSLRLVSRLAGDDTFAVGRSLLRSLVAELTGRPIDTVQITARCQDCGGPHGRPVVTGTALHLGLSHSAAATVAVASWHSPVGVDMEDVGAPTAALRAIGTLTGRPSLRHWTRVEATLKADGRGLRVDPASVAIHEVDGRCEASIAGAPERYLISQPAVAPDLLVSVATQI